MSDKYNLNDTSISIHPAGNKILALPEAQEEEEMYNVSILHFDEKKISRKIEFTLGLQPLEETTHGMKWRLSKSDFLLNGLMPENVVDGINCRIATMLYPVYIETDRQGLFVNVIADENIYERWETLQAEFRIVYKGNIFEGIIAATESVISDTTLLKSMHANDWIIRLLFTGVYGYYDKTGSKAGEWTLTLPDKEQNIHARKIHTHYAIDKMQKKIFVESKQDIDNATADLITINGTILLHEATNMLIEMSMHIQWDKTRAATIQVHRIREDL